ncbi:MAG: DUF2341 domain-containing protein [Bacteroidia bacterium]
MKSLLFALISFLYVEGIFAQCGNDNIYKLPVTVTNSSSSIIPSGLGLIKFNSALYISQNQLKLSGNDLRVGLNCCSFFPFWIDTSTWNTTETNIWVRLPSIPATSSLNLELSFGGSNAINFSSFSNTFLSVYSLNSGVDTLSGTLIYDWFEIKPGATVYTPIGQILSVQAANVVIRGNIIGDERGFAGAKNIACSPGSGPGGGIVATTCLAGGAGAYGGNAGCTQAVGNICAIAGALAYGTSTGLDIQMGSGGSTGTMGGTGNSAGNGGGAIEFDCTQFFLSGSISMNGQDGQSSTTFGTAGGGGAGGGILIKSNFIKMSNGILSAKGGKAGNANAASGSGGRIKLFYQSSLTGPYTSNVTSTNVHSMGGTVNFSGAVGQNGSSHTAQVLLNKASIAIGSFGSSSCIITFYSKPTGPLDSLSTWGVNTNGTGLAPSSFGGNNTVFVLRNRKAVTLNSNLFFTGNGCVFMIADSLQGTKLTIPSNVSLYCDSFVLFSNCSLEVLGSISFNKSYFLLNSNTSFLEINSTQQIPSASYYNLHVAGSNKLLLGNSIVRNLLVLQSVINSNQNTLTLGSSPIETGSLQWNSGYISEKFERRLNSFMPNAQSVQFPIGAKGKVQLVKLNISSMNLSGTIRAEFDTSLANNFGLPLIDTTAGLNQQINKTALDGFWRLKLISGTFTGTYSAEFHANQFRNNNQVAGLRLLSRPNLALNWNISGTHVPFVQLGNIIIANRSNLNLLNRDFVLSSDSILNPLPVRFVNVFFKSSEPHVQLIWLVTNEVNVSKYVVEYFENNKWIQFNTVDYKYASGMNMYSILIPTELSDRCFRIKEIDFDSKFTYSKMICGTYNSIEELDVHIWPNPVDLRTTIQLKNYNNKFPISINVFDELGKEVSVFLEQTSNSEFNLQFQPNQAKGLYYLKLNMNEENRILKLIKL